MSANVISDRPPSISRRDTSGEFEIAMSPSATTRVIENTDLNSGSSRHGNARRQSVDCICVVAITRSEPSAVDERRSVEAAEPIVDHAVEGELDPVRADRERLAGRHRDPLQVGVDVKLASTSSMRAEWISSSAAFSTRPSNDGSISATSRLDHHRTGEGRRVEIWFETNLVAGRQSVAWQAMGVDHPRDTTLGRDSPD